MGDRLSTSLSAESLKLAAATLLLSPHVPLLFMGEEYGEQNPFLFFTSHSDPTLIANLREGRRKEFEHFNWEGEVPDPQSEEVFNNSMLSWKLDNMPGLFNFYQHLIRFRRTRPAMQNFPRYDAVRNIRIYNNVLQFERHGNDDVLIIFLNFGQDAENIQSEQLGACKLLMDSSDELWEGPGSISPALIQTGQPFLLNPLSVIVLEQAEKLSDELSH
jgi:maltooligosyltrehalose trehalohydrolase